jgi:hypothetical protein
MPYTDEGRASPRHRPLNRHNYEKNTMPLDLCHPTAPHEKLKLPEWYVSSLMMDRALDAICRRVKKFDRKHDVPYLAGYSLDGKTIYIDRHMPASFKFKGRTINTDRFLILHEEVEKTLIDQLGLHYESRDYPLNVPRRNQGPNGDGAREVGKPVVQYIRAPARTIMDPEAGVRLLDGCRERRDSSCVGNPLAQRP